MLCAHDAQENISLVDAGNQSDDRCTISARASWRLGRSVEVVASTGRSTWKVHASKSPESGVSGVGMAGPGLSLGAHGIEEWSEGAALVYREVLLASAGLGQAAAAGSSSSRQRTLTEHVGGRGADGRLVERPARAAAAAGIFNAQPGGLRARLRARWTVDVTAARPPPEGSPACSPRQQPALLLPAGPAVDRPSQPPSPRSLAREWPASPPLFSDLFFLPSRAPHSEDDARVDGKK